MKNVLITGANSYIGTSVEKYIAEHHPNECRFDTVDMINSAWLEKDFSNYDVVLHVAGIAHQKETKENADAYYKINRDLAIEVAHKAKDEGVKQLILLSSMSVYGMLNGRIVRDTPLKPNTNYGKSKLQAEEKINTLIEENFKVCILRPPMIYGKECKGNYRTLRKFALKLKFFPYVKNERSMLYIENLCEFIWLMILNEENGVFFPQNSEYTNTSEMVKMIATSNDRKLYLVHGFSWAIKFLGLFTRLVKKAFGCLIYDKELSKYNKNYTVIGLRESIEFTESDEGSHN